MTKYEQQRFHELFRKGWTFKEIKKQIDKELKEQKANYEDLFGELLKKK